jgi:hypothetical protein
MEDIIAGSSQLAGFELLEDREDLLAELADESFEDIKGGSAPLSTVAAFLITAGVGFMGVTPKR